MSWAYASMQAALSRRSSSPLRAFECMAATKVALKPWELSLSQFVHSGLLTKDWLTEMIW